MSKLSWVAYLAAVTAIGFPGRAVSHHSHSMFDHSQQVTLTGTVTEFSFRNPHVFLFIDVEEKGGGTLNYWVEMSNIPNMIRRGIGANTFKPGDVVTVNVFPLADGRPGGNYATIVASDGKTYD
jgi:Family of unknown function (DUF6152)